LPSRVINGKFNIVIILSILVKVLRFSPTTLARYFLPENVY
jgi:hypothetical protein